MFDTKTLIYPDWFLSYELYVNNLVKDYNHVTIEKIYLLKVILKNFKIFCVLLFTLIVWASAFIAIRIGLQGYNPGALGLLRFLIASVFTLFIYLLTPYKKQIPWTDKLQMLFIGVYGIGIYNLTLNYGECTVNAGMASFIIGLIPIWTLILLIIFYKEKPNFSTYLGILISMIGMVCIFLSESRLGYNTTLGVIATFISSLAGAGYIVAQKKFLLKYHPIIITSWIIWGGTLFLGLFFPYLAAEFTQAPIKATIAAVYMGIFPAALGYLAWNYVLSLWSLKKVSLSQYALPIISSIMGCLILNERPSFVSFIGGLVALLGALISSQDFNSK